MFANSPSRIRGASESHCVDPVFKPPGKTACGRGIWGIPDGGAVGLGTAAHVSAPPALASKYSAHLGFFLRRLCFASPTDAPAASSYGRLYSHFRNNCQIYTVIGVIITPRLGVVIRPAGRLAGRGRPICHIPQNCRLTIITAIKIYCCGC